MAKSISKDVKYRQRAQVRDKEVTDLDPWKYYNQSWINILYWGVEPAFKPDIDSNAQEFIGNVQ